MANCNLDKAASYYYPGYRHPKLLIDYVVWSYHRFQLSLRDVSEQLMMRGLVISPETIREWSLRFGQTYAKEIKRQAPRRGDKWHMDEMFLVMKGKKLLDRQSVPEIWDIAFSHLISTLVYTTAASHGEPKARASSPW